MSERPISTTADFTFDVVAADLDGDGRRDVASFSINDEAVVWYPNPDVGVGPGQKPFLSSPDRALRVLCESTSRNGPALVQPS